jgi:hypothetical protein
MEFKKQLDDVDKVIKEYTDIKNKPEMCGWMVDMAKGLVSGSRIMLTMHSANNDYKYYNQFVLNSPRIENMIRDMIKLCAEEGLKK